jgi:hypothetical protein
VRKTGWGAEGGLDLPGSTTEDPPMLERSLVVLVKVALYLLVLVCDLVGGTLSGA